MNIFVKLGTIIEEQGLELVYGPEGYKDIDLTVAEVNRPSLPIAGFFDCFDPRRVQILGKVEHTYLEQLSAEERLERFNELFSRKIPALVITSELPAFPEMI